MRLIGHLPSESTARTFGDYLYVQGIQNQIEHHTEEGWGVWVNEEDQLERASKLLTAFRENPGDPQYAAQVKDAAERRAESQRGEAAYQKKLKNRRHLFRPLTEYGVGPLSFGLIVISVLVFILSRFGTEPERVMSLFIANFDTGWDPTFSEIRHGEVWRLVTPVFIHFGVLHILFNMMWLYDLGSMIEGRQSTRLLAGMVLTVAACSNLAQAHFGHSPVFGGMSGVVYGLLGYVWIRGKLDPGSGLFLHPTTVTMMIIWFAACYTGLVGHVANTAHAVGLGMGMAWGWLSSLRYR